MALGLVVMVIWMHGEYKTSCTWAESTKLLHMNVYIEYDNVTKGQVYIKINCHMWMR